MRCYSTACEKKATHYCHHFNRCRHAGCMEHLHYYRVGKGNELMLLCGECFVLYLAFDVPIELVDTPDA